MAFQPKTESGFLPSSIPTDNENEYGDMRTRQGPRLFAYVVSELHLLQRHHFKQEIAKVAAEVESKEAEERCSFGGEADRAAVPGHAVEDRQLRLRVAVLRHRSKVFAGRMAVLPRRGQFSLDAGRMSFDDPRYPLEEPRASWDGYLLERSNFPRMPTMLSVVEDASVQHVMRTDTQIPVEEDSVNDDEFYRPEKQLTAQPVNEDHDEAKDDDDPLGSHPSSSSPSRPSAITSPSALSLSNYDSEPMLHNCGISINSSFTEVEGCVLQALRKFVRPVKIENWVVVNFCARCDVQGIVRNLIKCGQMKGIHPKNPNQKLAQDSFDGVPKHQSKHMEDSRANWVSQLGFALQIAAALMVLCHEDGGGLMHREEDLWVMLNCARLLVFGRGYCD
ncbi:hypothetical protein LR48_Vigan846s000900 [Vigna angularis]|uniref:Uncharacterized protein n=1 Tax=Phaseolus angularis TaxID=3914 RepID=A0A0L9THM2_PHAAN|nr:hypothetical protein LR48_Vigan846s000900 [Vigna angularis]